MVVICMPYLTETQYLVSLRGVRATRLLVMFVCLTRRGPVIDVCTAFSDIGAEQKHVVRYWLAQFSLCQHVLSVYGVISDEQSIWMFVS